MWQPIDTAPDDGTFYLAHDGKDYMVLNSPKGCMRGRWHKHRNGNWYGSGEGYFKPIEWQPLPKIR